MKQFSAQSMERLSTCHPQLQTLFIQVLQSFDCTIIEGHRDQAAQNKAVAEGKSKNIWPTGKHNSIPSMAVDVAPYPIDWADTQRFYYFAGFVMGTAKSLGIKIRFGGNWSGDTQVKNEKFKDLVHFELIL